MADPIAARPLPALTAGGYLLDLDGTLVLGDSRNEGLEPLPGALAFTAALRRRGIPFVIATNGTGRSPARYAETLRGLGFELAADAVLTPVSAAIEVLVRRGQRRVLALGNSGVTGPLAEAGLELVPPTGRSEADAVLVAGFREFTMDALEAACAAVWSGARLYAASRSPFYASRDGRALGTALAITAMIRSLTGCPVEVVGKPAPHLLRVASRRLGVPVRNLAVVGDDPDLEIAMARRGGAQAIAVQTGIGRADGFAARPPARRPHLVVPGVADLVPLLPPAATAR